MLFPALNWNGEQNWGYPFLVFKAQKFARCWNHQGQAIQLPSHLWFSSICSGSRIFLPTARQSSLQSLESTPNQMVQRWLFSTFQVCVGRFLRGVWVEVGIISLFYWERSGRNWDRSWPHYLSKIVNETLL